MYQQLVNLVRCLAICASIALPSTALAFQETAEESFALAANHYSIGDYDRAQAGFDQLFKNHPNEPEALLGLFFRGECLVQLGRFDESFKVFKAFVEEPQSAERDDLRGYLPQAIYRAGESAFLSSNNEQAAIYLTRFVDENPDHQLSAFAVPYLADIAFESGEFENAAKLYQSQLQAHPESTLAEHCRFSLALTYVQLGNIADASRFLQAVVSQGGGFATQALYELARLNYEEQYYLKAAELCAKYLDDYPNGRERLDCYYLLAAAQLDLDHPDAAISLIARLDSEREQLLNNANPEIRILADSFHADTAVAIRFRLAKARMDVGDYPNADLLFASIIEQFPSSDLVDDAFEFRVRAAYLSRDDQLVQQLTDAFIASQPESEFYPIITDTAGRSAYEAGNFQTAQQWFADAIVNYQSSSESSTIDIAKLYYMEGLAWIGLKQLELAADTLESGLEQLAQPTQLKDLTASPDALRAAFHLALATTFDGLSDLPNAIKHRAAYVRLDSSSSVASRCLTDLVVCYLKLDDVDSAQKTLEEIADLFPSNGQRIILSRLLAESAYQASRFDVASEQFEFLSKHAATHKDRAAAFSGLAWIQYKLDEPELAAMTFLDVISETETGELAAEAWYMLGRIAEDQGSFEQAIGCYSQVSWCEPESKHHWDSLLREARIRKELGSENHLQMALSLFDMAISSEDASHVDRLMFESAVVCERLNMLDDATNRLETVINEYPESEIWSEAAYHLAEQLASNDEQAAADSLLNEILSKPNRDQIHSFAHFKLGHHAALRSDWLSVREHMSHVDLEVNSTLVAAATYWLGESNFRLADYEKASNHFTNLLSSDSSTPEWIPSIQLRLAQIDAVSGKWAKSLRAAEALMSQREQLPQDYELDYLLGRCYSALGRFNDARESYQEVLRSPTGARTETAAKAQWMIGESYFHQAEYDKAIDAYFRVDVLFPYSNWKAAALLQAAKCHEKAGRSAQAAKVFARLLKEHPESAFAEEASRRLQMAQSTEPNETIR